VRDMRIQDQQQRANDGGSHSSRYSEGRHPQEQAACSRDMQQPQGQQAELFSARLLERFRYLLNPELARLIAEDAEEFWGERCVESREKARRE